jgi:ATP-binding protein involved in chromosome partitioning
MTQPTEDAVRGALLGVIDPELGDNIVDLGMVRGIVVAPGGEVTVTVALTVAGCPLQKQLRSDVLGRVGAVPGVTGVTVQMGEMSVEEKTALMARARWKARDRGIATDIPATTRILAIGSGKGGVGKSSITANLAVALAGRGLVVGVLDADIWGFSLPRMLGVEGHVGGEDKKMIPIEQPVGTGLLRVLSMGLIGGAAEDQAIMWRGLILNRAVQHFLEDVRWGNLDYLLIDMPPGTGDVQMGLARMLPRADLIIVTTPALAAQKVASRAADMARRGYLRVAGVIENMTAFTADDGKEYALFGSGGGARLAAELGVPLLGSVPIEAAVAVGGDIGRPAALGSGPAATALQAIAERIATEVAPPMELTGCTAQMLDRIEEVLGAAGV